VSRRGRKTVTLCVTVGVKEMEMLREVAERCGFLSLSEAARAAIRHYHRTAAQICGMRPDGC
jgi:hypothetical protein